MGAFVTTETLTFRAACCDRFRCPEDRFERAVFFHCLHGHAVVPARIIYFLHPTAFSWDFELIRYVATATSLVEFEQEANRYVQNSPPSGFLHGALRIRVSGQKLMNLGRDVFN
jgi:hypothetical protein